MATEYTMFMKGNAVSPSNVKVTVSDRFLDKDGKPVEWEIKPITAAMNEALREKNTTMAPVGKKGISMPRTDVKNYLADLAITSTVFPNLNDQALQDSYGVMGARELLRTMLIAGEYEDYIEKVQLANGYDLSLADEAEKVKN